MSIFSTLPASLRKMDLIDLTLSDSDDEDSDISVCDNYSDQNRSNVLDNSTTVRGYTERNLEYETRHIDGDYYNENLKGTTSHHHTNTDAKENVEYGYIDLMIEPDELLNTRLCSSTVPASGTSSPPATICE